MIITGAQFSGGMVISAVAQPVVTAGLKMQLDANNPASYSGSGSTWYDISGNNADITLVSSPTYTSGTPSYFSFNGSNQYGTGSTSQILGANAYSKTMWFRLSNYGYNNNIISSYNGGHFTFFSGGDKMYNGHEDWLNYNAYPSTMSFSLNTWYYAAITFSTTNGMTLYVNGVLDSTYTANKDPKPGDGSCDIASYQGSNNLCGDIGHVFCYNAELTASEVLQNYNTTKSIYGL